MSVIGSPEDPCVWLRAVCIRKLGVTEGSLVSPPTPAVTLNPLSSQFRSPASRSVVPGPSKGPFP